MGGGLSGNSGNLWRSYSAYTSGYQSVDHLSDIDEFEESFKVKSLKCGSICIINHKNIKVDSLLLFIQDVPFYFSTLVLWTKLDITTHYVTQHPP